MARISIVASPDASRVARAVQAELGERGHDCVLYPSSAALAGDAAAIAASDVILAMPGQRVTAGMVAQASRLRALISLVTGTEQFDDAAATKRGVIVVSSQVPENYVSMAESTVLMMLAALYEFERSQRLLRENANGPIERRARMLQGKTVGLVGFGQISRSVAERLAPWGVTLLTSIRQARDDIPGNVRVVALDELLAQSDVVALLTNLDDTTRGLLDERRLRLMKDNVVFVNTARGPIVDEKALIRIARERPRMRLALDVFAVEPLPADSALRDLPEAILTPHMVGHTVETTQASLRMVLHNVERVLAGTLPVNVRNPSVIDEWCRRWSSS